MDRQRQTQEKSVKNMCRTAETLSEMLGHTVAEVRRLQKQQEKALGRRFADKTELEENYDTKAMKEMTTMLKDITAVVKALEESDAGREEAKGTGVVLLPPVESPADAAARLGSEPALQEE
ncbi:MAG: hypothetical protein LKJ90_09520 [Faecalibacterium sp.]|jgi:hypothetical protein|nr:hypothetical protein [Faecalibacterium sp.]